MEHLKDVIIADSISYSVHIFQRLVIPFSHEYHNPDIFERAVKQRYSKAGKWTEIG